MKRILVPTDFSSTAEKAFRCALDIASKAAGTIILYHVYPPAEGAFMDSVEKRKMYNAQTEANLLKRLQRLKKKVTANTADVPVSTVIGRTPILDNILGFAEDKKIDLIVMGTQGRSGLKKVIVGSNAARVIEKSDIPVLLIPGQCEWKSPEQMVFATNYLKTDRQALSIIFSLAKLYNAMVTVVHLVNEYVMEKEKEKSDFDTYAYAIQRTFAESKMKFQLLETTSVAAAMENLHNEVPYDLLVMVRQEKTFLERFFLDSFTKKMAYVTNRPLLVVPGE